MIRHEPGERYRSRLSLKGGMVKYRRRQRCVAYAGRVIDRSRGSNTSTRETPNLRHLPPSPANLPRTPSHMHTENHHREYLLGYPPPYLTLKSNLTLNHNLTLTLSLIT